MITIRKEEPKDYPEVRRLVTAAFATVEYGDGTEAHYLDSLREKPTFIPELSLVAETGDKTIAGQIVLCKTEVAAADGMITTLVLSPLSVRPEYFRRGIARSLMERAFGIARELGYTSVFLCGEPEIYHGLGFVPSYTFGIHHRKDPKADWCLARELVPGALETIQGIIDIV
ncbi:GNAT family N-acetyltransferase [Breznakiella homolactica]|uniref:N-acetyltransferase n=1 Tax=Breznakiella homolactica TaxID=2798577 RepID=A0A7T7XM33_9SPIR|nr:N-acetyltransferase [Breznakiella homolactica]QQO08743.1 N-acetyltransferase [Breznakiella homolactica]